MAEEQAKETTAEQPAGEFEDEGSLTLETHLKINRALSGEVMTLRPGYAKVLLETSAEMAADEVGLVHGGFIFSAADFAAMAAVNERNVVLAAADCQFLAPVRVQDEVTFEATVRHKDGRKRNVKVIGKVLDIKVFQAEFKTVVTEHHVLRLRLLENVEELERED